MSIKQILMEIRVLLKRWFAKRNIIIVSEKGVKHIPVTVSLQVGALAICMAFICWASYSTGSFVAARHALKEQGQTLRSVASAHVSNSMDPLVRTKAPNFIAPAPTIEPMFTMSALKTNDMASRVAYLESKVNELKTANAEIIQRVQEKTDGNIERLESIITKTGLDADVLKKQAAKTNGQGGPFIPADMNELKKSKDELFSDLDKLSHLREIVYSLPLGLPIRGAQPQSGFGHRYDPFSNRLAFHSGLDLAGPAGSKIYSTADGVVVTAERNSSYGNMIDIDHGNGISTRYGHLSEIRVEQGQRVKRGDWIGVQGSTGRSTGPHLHYEVRKNDAAMNPKNFLEVGRYVSQE